MLRDDRLRSKKDDLARVISSRKRKLSELYYATVDCAPAATETETETEGVLPAPSPDYRQRELQFLDLNDITRGRWFDESTLPPKRLLSTSPAETETPQLAESTAVTDDPNDSSSRSRPSSPPLPPPETQISAPSAHAHASLRVDASQTLQDVNMKPHSSPISEASPRIVDQHPTSPSSSVTSITAHTSTLSPSKEALLTEARRSAAQQRAPETPALPSQSISSSIEEHPRTGLDEQPTEAQARPVQQLPLKHEIVEDDSAPTELSRIAPHTNTPSKDSAQQPAHIPSDIKPSDQPSTQPSTPHAKPTTPSNGRRPVSPARPVERMTTRVSSGAIRHKSVSEILGEKPKAQTPPATKELRESAVSSPRWRPGERQKKEKERSKLSTVIFPKQSPNQKGRFQGFQSRHDLVAGPDGTRASQRHGALSRSDTANEENDYLFTLFQAKAHLPPRSIHLNVLLSTAHKILSTSDHLVDYNEQMSCRTLKRLYQLQSANRWPLRQLQRAREPRRQACHWDVLIDHARWMSTDFREERKWKISVAKACAEWCKQYAEASPAEKATLRVNAHIPPHTAKLTQTAINDTNGLGEHSIPDLIFSHEDDSIADDLSDDPHPDLSDDNVPAAIFSLGCDQFTFNMERTAASDAMLGELPLYTPVQMDTEGNMPLFPSLPDSEWQTEILPVTKFAQGKLELPPRGPPRKKSRYQYYDSDDEDEENDVDRPSIPPERGVISLFDHDSKLSRERLYAAGAFRSPIEFPVPRQEFFDERVSSVWTPAEDEELRRLVKEYSFNWSLVASCLTHRSSQGWASPQCSSRSSSNFISAAERRTPWECFERWTSLEPLPVEIARHPVYVKYRAIIDRSQQKLLTAQQLAMQQHQAAGQPLPQSPMRRKTNVPVSADQKYSTRHIAELDAIRKLVKKREAIAQKQVHTNQVASQRKINEMNQPKPPYSTPQEWAKIKQERDQKLNEQARQNYIAQQ
ncbi:chromatin modification- protein VID21, partial [Ascosphaera pollenicola]